MWRMVEVVMVRLRTLLLLLVASAILYVLISPLPEMTATKSVQPFVLAFILLVVASATDHLAAFLLSDQPFRLDASCDLQAVLCSRLC